MLTEIGTIDGDCSELELTGALEAMVASFSQGKQEIDAIHYAKGGKTIAFGTLVKGSYYQWKFPDDEPLIGLYGR